MQVLVALRRANGAVVSKDDLARLCWHGRVVGDDAINRVISRLRAAAQQYAGGQFHVETITKVGYRLSTLTQPVDASPSPAAAPAQAEVRGLSRRKIALGGAAAACAALAGVRWAVVRNDHLSKDAQALVDAAQKPMYEGTVEETSDAIGALRQAAQIAPNSALVWGQLAYAYMRQSLQAPSKERVELRTRADAAIQRAFSIERGQPDALAAQITGMQVFQNWLAVDRACRRALRLNPDNLGLQYAMLNLLMQTGRTKEALSVVQRATQLNPTIAHFDTALSTALWDLGRLDEAEAAIARGTALWPRIYRVWFTNVYFLMYNGKAAQALAIIDDVANRPVGIPSWNFEVVRSQATALASGDTAKVREGLEQSVASARRGIGFAENAAIFAGFVGELGTAFDILSALYFGSRLPASDIYFTAEQAIYSGTERHTYVLFRRPLRRLRADDRFEVLTRKLGLDAYWQQTGSRAFVTP